MARAGTRFGVHGILAGSGSVGGSLLMSGLTTYLFLAVAARATGPEKFGLISTLWALTMIVGPGLFMPLQQELGRLIASSSDRRSGRSSLMRSVGIAVAMISAIVIVAVLTGRLVADRLFGGDTRLVACFVVAVVGYAASYVSRGLFSGLGKFGRFGALIVVESAARLVIAVCAALAGAHSVLPFAAAIAAGPVIAVVVVTRRAVRLNQGEDVAWRDLSQAFGWLLIASLGAQAVANLGPLTVQWTAASPGGKEAGQFLAALLVARVTLYLFQAVQAAVLPNVAALVAAGAVEQARAAVRVLVSAVLALFVASTLGAYVLGPWAVGLLFGSDFHATRVTMATLAAGTSAFILATALTGAALALGGHRANAAAWLSGCVTFVACALLLDDVFVRAEVGYALGSVVSAIQLQVVVMVLSRRAMNAHTAEDL